MPIVNRAQLHTFAEDGYVVLPRVVPQTLIDAARQEIAARVAQNPPAPGAVGPNFYFVMRDATQDNALPPPLLAPFFASAALPLAQALIGDGACEFDPLDHVQISRIIPPWPHRPGGPHIDGLTPPEPDGRPSTFTMLAGIFLTDQSRENAGNLWVWPGSHRQTASYLRQHGPDTLVSCVPYPPVALGTPRQVTAQPGDLLLAHYLLGHNIGGNVSDTVREALYYRLKRSDHRARWRNAVQDPLLEFDSVRNALRE
jgi:hypothetical protein